MLSQPSGDRPVAQLCPQFFTGTISDKINISGLIVPVLYCKAG